ncbi:MAG TPA: TIM-barrel domain-containing protein, partial [Solirubrobacteraceae bacterium]|nr:TIM-barrel domain-containing protein [Solirubrobacteraceae bacterium]
MRLRAAIWASATALVALACAAPAMARSDVIRAGRARFEVLTPTLMRVEYAADGRFQNRPTMTATRAPLPVPPLAVSRANGLLTIRTRALTLRYRLGSGAFAAGNLTASFTLGAKPVTVDPAPGDAQGNLGGWRRGLDLLDSPVQLSDGLLSSAGWYVLDDTTTALLTSGSPGFAVRPAHRGPYQDWYLFAYGHNYARGLEDLRALTGPAPMLPRSAFGVWFSRYYPYSESDYQTLLTAFRSNRVPLDTLSVDTDWKRESDPTTAPFAAIVAGAPGKPYSWDGWEWDTTLFPDPQRFIDWAHSEGLSITLNIHPSISTNDPQWPATNAAAGGLQTSNGECRILIADPTAQCGVFDWTNPRQIDAYFALHKPLEQDGVDFFWLDWCCDASSAVAPGLTADTWINSLYARQERQRGLRWLSFARAGASYNGDSVDGDDQNGGDGIFAEHRYTIQFTGDTCATWQMLGFEAEFSAEEGNVGLPYLSDDIGSFNGQPEDGQCSAETGLLNEHLPDDLYARWVAFGTFQPLDRLHSNHGDRLPWEYGPAADAASAGFLRLREALNPYIYTLDRRTYDTGLPMTGALYLQWPTLAAAYEHPSEYTFGPDMVVEPVTADGDPAPATIWVPPGEWVDYFTGQALSGPSVRTLSVPLDQMPVLVRAGTIVPTEPYALFTPPGPQRTLILTVYPGARGSFSLYDDQGVGFGYTRGSYSRTPLVHTERARRDAVTIGPASGSFPGALRRRFWTVVFVGVRRPRAVTLDGRRLAPRRW